jgi:hypothetical protein
MTALEDALRAADGIVDAFLPGKHVPGVAYGVIVPAVRGDGTTTATWRLRGSRDDRDVVDLELDRDTGTGIVTRLSLVPKPPVTPPYAD